MGGRYPVEMEGGAKSGVQEFNGHSEPLEQASFFDLLCSGIVSI